MLGLLFFYGPLFERQTLYFRDLSTLHLLQKEELIQFIRNHEFPLWDRYIQGGQSYIGHITGDPLYPSNALYFFFPLLTAFNWDLVLHLILCSLSAYLLTRALGLNALSSLIAGIVYAYSGHTLSKMNFYFRLLVLPYLPLLILFWHLYLSKGQKRWFVLLIIAGSLQMLAGALEAVFFHYLVLLGWVIVYPYSQPAGRRLQIYLLALALSIGIASVQLFPVAEVIFYSHRPRGFSYSFFSQWSIHPKRLMEMLVPGFIGFKDTMSQSGYWGRSLEDGPAPFILSIYFGFPALFLGLVALFHKTSNPILHIRVRKYLLFLIAVGVGLSLGRFLPGFHGVYRIFPLIRLIRYPAKFFSFAVLPIALLSAYGAQSLLEIRSADEKKLLAAGWLTCGLIVFCFLAIYASPEFANGFEQFFFNGTNSFARNGLIPLFLHSSLASLATMCVLQYHLFRPHKSFLLIVMLIVTADLLMAGLPLNFTAPRELFEQEPAMAQKIKNEMKDGKLYREAISEVKITPPSNDLMWGYRWDLEVLNRSMAAFYQIPLVFNNDLDGLQQETLLRLKNTLESMPWSQRSPLLSAAGVTLILTQQQINAPNLSWMMTFDTSSSVKSYLYRNVPSRLFYFVHESKTASSAETALQEMLKPDFDPQNIVVLEKSSRVSSTRSCEPAAMKILEARNNRVIYSVSTTCDGYMVFSDPYFPGWQLRVDGRSEPLVRANYAFTAAFIKRGTHRVEKFYRPTSVCVGAATSLLSILILIWVLSWRPVSASTIR